MTASRDRLDGDGVTKIVRDARDRLDGDGVTTIVRATDLFSSRRPRSCVVLYETRRNSAPQKDEVSMAALFAAGGIPMLFVVAFGLIALVAAALFAIRPEPKKIDAIKSLSVATAFSVLAGVASDLAAVGYGINRNPEWARSENLGLIVLQGVAESMSPAIFGFSLLSVVWMVASVGNRRLRPQLTA